VKIPHSYHGPGRLGRVKIRYQVATQAFKTNIGWKPLQLQECKIGENKRAEIKREFNREVKRKFIFDD
jgi:hypothetical protein